MRTITMGPPTLDGIDADVLGVTVRPGRELSGAAARVDEWLDGALARCLEEGSFRAEADEVQLFPTGDRDRPAVVAVGVGTGEVGGERVRRAAGTVSREARGRAADTFAFAVPRAAGTDQAHAVRAAAVGVTLGDWSFDGLRDRDGAKGWRRNPRPGRAVLFAGGTGADRDGGADDLDGAAAQGRKIAEAQNFARDLAFQPANVVTPRHLAGRARDLAERYDALEAEAWGPERLREEGFGALLAVARGSEEPPRFITLNYLPPEAPERTPPSGGTDDDGIPTYVLAGKGVTFDAGGISLKPSEGMGDMKYDMSGAAAVLGAVRAAAELSLPVRVVGLVPATENLPSGGALKPADVIRGVSRKSIEIISTDAEGRLILSDTLSHAARYRPDAVVDVATLTGGCIVALGRHAAGLLTDDDGMADALIGAGERTGERLWRLPLWDAYREQLDSEIADVKNTGGKGASTVTAAWFLKEFVGSYRWAHLDIAGTAWAEKATPLQPEGATGFGVRLLAEWLLSESRAGR